MPRKLTHEQFMEKFYKQNTHAKDIEILGTYINARTKILCKCKKDGYEWETRPATLLQGNGCPKCAGTMKKTHEQFIKELAQVNSNIEVLGTYKNSQTKIRVKCKIDGYEWEAWPLDLITTNGRKRTGCPKCAGNIKKTHNEFIKELAQLNPGIQVLNTYKNGHTKIKVKCKVDGYIWYPTPNSLLRGCGCPKCYENRRGDGRRKTHNQFIKELHEVNPDINILGTYINGSTKILCKCLIDGHEWEATPNNLLNGHGCPKCKTIKHIEQHFKTHEQFIKELAQINHDIEVLDTYKNGRTKIKVKCKIDGYEWEVIPNSLLSMNSGCPKCNISKGEKRVAQYLDNLNIDYIYNKGYFNDLIGTGGGVM